MPYMVLQTHLSLCLHVPPLRSTSTFSTVRTGQCRLQIQRRTSGFSTASSAWSIWPLSEASTVQRSRPSLSLPSLYPSLPIPAPHECMIPSPQLTVPGWISGVQVFKTAALTRWMAADERAALRRATAAIRQRYGDSFLFALQLAQRAGGRSKGGQGALGARLAQGPSRCRRCSVLRSASSPGPRPPSASARESSSCVRRVSCVHVWSVCACYRAASVNSARRVAGSAGESAAFI